MGMNVAAIRPLARRWTLFRVSAARSETPTPLERRAQKFPSSSTLHAAPGGGRCPPAPSPSLVGEPQSTPHTPERLSPKSTAQHLYLLYPFSFQVSTTDRTHARTILLENLTHLLCR